MTPHKMMTHVRTLSIQQRRVGEFPIDHLADAQEATIELLSSLQEGINVAIKEGAERVEMRYHNIPNDLTNPKGGIGMVRVIAYRRVDVDTDAEIESEVI